MRFERDNIVNYTHEVERLQKVCAEETQEIDNLEHVLKIIERYEMMVPFSSYVDYFSLDILLFSLLFYLVSW